MLKWLFLWTIRLNKRELSCVKLIHQSASFLGPVGLFWGWGMVQKHFWAYPPIQTYSFYFLSVALFCLLHSWMIELIELLNYWIIIEYNYFQKFMKRGSELKNLFGHYKFFSAKYWSKFMKLFTKAEAKSVTRIYPEHFCYQIIKRSPIC